MLFIVFLSVLLKMVETVKELSIRAVLHYKVQESDVFVGFIVFDDVGVVKLLQDSHFVH
jgi:hypothetical protein